MGDLQKLVDLDVKELLVKQNNSFTKVESELLAMKIQLMDTPSSDSLLALYRAQVMGRGYYERALSIYRSNLKYLSKVASIKKAVDISYKREYWKATAAVKESKKDEYKACKSGDERAALVECNIPEEIMDEYRKWDNLESQAKTNFSIVKSYVDEFKSIREEILVQLSIIKNLILLGDLKIDPETIRACRIIDTSYRPTQQDFRDRDESLHERVQEIPAEEGIIKL